MKKRLLSLILVFAMVFGMMPTMAFAGDQMEDTVYISASRDGEYLAFDNHYQRPDILRRGTQNIWPLIMVIWRICR